MRDLLTSKKFIAAVIGVLVVVAGHFGLELDEEALMQLVGVIIAYIVGQGIADAGKEAEKVRRS